MQGISSSALSNTTPNRKKFNGIEETRDLDLNQYDAFYRTLDPQTGRFLQIDPKIESAEAWSPYSAMLDNPIRYMDPLGDSTIPGAGFWRNVWEGVKDGGGETVGFVRSLGTTEGWKNLGNGLLDLADRANMSSPTGMMKNAQTAQNIVEGVKNIPNMSKDDWGHAIGYGTEKVAEVALLSKGANVVTNAVKGVKASMTLGDLTKGEIKVIQSVVDKAERPIEVVGSAASGTRRGIGTNLPIGKGIGTRSDIDYIAPPSHLPYFDGLQGKLPNIDPHTGIIPGLANPYMGPIIRFEPKSSPQLIPKISN